MKNKKSMVLISITLFVLFALSLRLAVLFPLTTKHEAGVIKQPVKKYMILIDVEDCKLFLIEDGKCVKQYLIAPGKPSTPSPLGLYKIVHKDTWGEGFGGRWMGLNVPWGKFGIHGTIFPGSIGGQNSHGCIRMWNKQVKELYKIVPSGTPVLLLNGPYGPFGQGLRTLRPGSYGLDVKVVQKRLKELGFYQYNADGRFGPAMEYALYKFQRSKNLPKRNRIGKSEYDAMGIIEFE